MNALGETSTPLSSSFDRRLGKKRKTNGSNHDPASPSSQETLYDYLLKSHSPDARLRVAKNLCIAICSTKKTYLSIGRISPDQILVNPETCGVFLSGEATAKSSEIATHNDDRSNEEPYDAFFHVYTIMQGVDGLQIEQAAWGKEHPHKPTYEEMSSAILATRKRPRLILLLDKAFPSGHFSSPFWNEPPWKKSLYEAYTLNSHPQHASSFPALEKVAFDIFSRIDRPEHVTLKGQSSALEKVGEVLSGGGDARAELKKNERRLIGSRGLGQTMLFWSATVGTSLAIGWFSASCGYAPFDAALHPTNSLVLPEKPAALRFQYFATSFLGCVFCNTFLLKRNVFRGFQRQTYFESFLFAIAFMSAARFVIDAFAGAMI